MSAQASSFPAAAERPNPSDLNKGYLFWGPVFVAIIGTELAGAAGGWLQKHLDITIPWPTISSMIGHLQDRWSIVGVIVVGTIAAFALHALAPAAWERRTALGRTYLRGTAHPKRLGFYNWWVGLGAAAAVGGAAMLWSDDKYVRGYWIYGGLAVFAVVIPSILAIALKREVVFPTLFFTLRGLRERAHWVATVVGAGLAILAIHLALYPWPDITRESSHYAGITATTARDRAERVIRQAQRSAKLTYSTQARGIVSGRDAWLVFFSPTEDSGSTYAGCIVIVTDKATSPTSECSA